LADGGVDDDGIGMCLLTPDEGVTAELVIAGGDDIWYQRQGSLGDGPREAISLSNRTFHTIS